MNLIKERVLKEASYIIETKKTIRDLAKKYKLSKSTIHNDLTTKLKKSIKHYMQEFKIYFRNIKKFAI